MFNTTQFSVGNYTVCKGLVRIWLCKKKKKRKENQSAFKIHINIFTENKNANTRLAKNIIFAIKISTQNEFSNQRFEMDF